MNCETVQELLLTDYSDGQTSVTTRREVDQHLASCKHCKRFAKELATVAIEPFKRTDRCAPPDQLWSSIAQAIREEPVPSRSIAQTLVARLTAFPRTALAAAAIVLIASTILLSKLGPFYRHNGTDSYLEEQIDFLSQLDVQQTSSYDQEIGTSIEEYFL